VDHNSTFGGTNKHASSGEAVYADALLHYWSAVKDAERTIAPFFTDGKSLTAHERGIVAEVVADVRAAEDAYFAALQAAGRQPSAPFVSPKLDP
jgi:hypothetical protein